MMGRAGEAARERGGGEREGGRERERQREKREREKERERKSLCRVNGPLGRVVCLWAGLGERKDRRGWDGRGWERRGSPVSSVSIAPL